MLTKQRKIVEIDQVIVGVAPNDPNHAVEAYAVEARDGAAVVRAKQLLRIRVHRAVDAKLVKHCFGFVWRFCLNDVVACYGRFLIENNFRLHVLFSYKVRHTKANIPTGGKHYPGNNEPKYNPVQTNNVRQLEFFFIKNFILHESYGCARFFYCFSVVTFG